MPPPYAAHLRVYEPLAAFAPDDQRYWRSYVQQKRAPDPREGPAIERVGALVGQVTELVPFPVEVPEQAFVLDSGTLTVVCPWSTRVRAAQAALDARDGVPPVLADAFVPPAVAEEAEGVLGAWRSRPEARLHVLSETWTVPTRWFTLFEARDRVLVLSGGERSLTYRTEMSRARRRGARSLSVLRRALGDVGVVAAMEDLARWLEEFHPRSVVELDYGGLVGLLDDDELEGDSSVADVADALAGLAAGDGARAGAAYERVTERWRRTSAAERAN